MNAVTIPNRATYGDSNQPSFFASKIQGSRPKPQTAEMATFKRRKLTLQPYIRNGQNDRLIEEIQTEVDGSFADPAA